MSEIELDAPDSEDDGIIYHYNVIGNSLPAWQIAGAINATNNILKNFDTKFLENQGETQLQMRPLRPGSVILDFTLNIIGNEINLFNLDLAFSIFGSLSGGILLYYKKKIKKLEDRLKKLEQAQGLPERRAFIESIHADFITLLLAADKEELENFFPIGEFEQAIKARNRIYRDCSKNKNVKGLGFSHHDGSRFRNFKEQIITSLKSHKGKQECGKSKWIIQTLDVEIISAGVSYEESEEWEGALDQFDKKNFSFWMYDEMYLQDVRSDGRKKASPGNKMRVLLAYQLKNGKIEDACVLKVSKINNRRAIGNITQNAKKQKEMLQKALQRNDDITKNARSSITDEKEGKLHILIEDDVDY